MNLKYFDVKNANFDLIFPPLTQTSPKSSNDAENLKTQKPDVQDTLETNPPKSTNSPLEPELKNPPQNPSNKKLLSTKALNSNSTVFYPNEKNAILKENNKNSAHKNSSQEYNRNRNSSRKEAGGRPLPEESKNYSKNFSNPPSFSKTISESSNLEEKIMGNSINYADVNNYQEPKNMNLMKNLNFEKREEDVIVKLILNLRDYNRREDALRELSQRREKCAYLATYLWFSVGTSTILLEEIIAVYPHLSPQQLTQRIANRLGYVIGLLQTCALHAEIRSHLISAHIPTYLYPFLRTTEQNKNFENIRIASLSVIGALIKNEFPSGVRFLLQTDEIIAVCFQIMTKQENLSKTVATFIILKIISEDCGLEFICNNSERFSYLTTVLQQMLEECAIKKKNDQKLIKQIVRCYLRLTDNPRSKEILKQILLPFLKRIGSEFITDESTKRIHVQLLHNLYKLDNDPKQFLIKNKNSEEPNY